MDIMHDKYYERERDITTFSRENPNCSIFGESVFVAFSLEINV